MVEIFKTNVHEPVLAAELVAMLQTHLPDGRINFDLHDCDRILRVEKSEVVPERIIDLMQAAGFECLLLE